MRSALGADLGTFYDMDKATVTVIFAMTVEEVREHRAGVYYSSAAFSARAEGATSLLRSLHRSLVLLSDALVLTRCQRSFLGVPRDPSLCALKFFGESLLPPSGAPRPAPPCC